jgi:NAD(P)-dependent dehydrogenase (short-subunit alcohol dehydrogenase family)
VQLVSQGEFNGCSLLLTGATSGLGQAIAERLAAAGAHLYLTGRSLPQLQALAESLPGNHTYLQLDLSACEHLEETLNPWLPDNLYGFCHCAGAVDTRPFKLVKPANNAMQMQVNYFAAFEIARIASLKQHMPGPGSLLFISSIYANVGAPGQAAYCASKAAITSAARALAVELAPRAIKVNSLAPGFVATTMTADNAKLSPQAMDAIIAKHPLGPGSAEQVARAAEFLLAPQNTWITGTQLIIDGGYSAQ